MWAFYWSTQRCSSLFLGRFIGGYINKENWIWLWKWKKRQYWHWTKSRQTTCYAQRNKCLLQDDLEDLTEKFAYLIRDKLILSILDLENLHSRIPHLWLRVKVGSYLLPITMSVFLAAVWRLLLLLEFIFCNYLFQYSDLEIRLQKSHDTLSCILLQLCDALHSALWHISTYT